MLKKHSIDAVRPDQSRYISEPARWFARQPPEPRTMNTKIVMISLTLSVLPIAGHAPIPEQGLAAHPMGGPSEPAADLNASVVLEEMTAEGSLVTGNVRVS